MLSLTIRRMVLLIPTLFIILCLSFVLKSLAPGDEVAKQLELEGSKSSLSKESYMESYKSLSAKYGLDRPKFYFSIEPSYFSDTLYRIQPLAKKSLLTSMLRQTKDWSAVSRFDILVGRLISQLDQSESDIRLISNEVLKMELDRSLSDIKSRSIKIRNLSQGVMGLPPELDVLLSHVEGMSTSKTFSWPVLKWHGWNNQFHHWTQRIFSDQNTSLIDGEPATKKISRAFKWTITMTSVALILIGLLALVLGYLQAYYQSGIFDNTVSYILYLLLAIPAFWLATMLVVFFTTPEFGSWTDIFPSIGLKPSFVARSFMSELMDNLAQLILPIICLVLAGVSFLAIQFRSDMVNTISKPYVLMARAKGLSYKQILRSHVLPNALVPFITIMTGALPNIFAGSVIIEVIFNIPGIGRLLLTSIRGSDWPVVFTIVIFISIATILSYLIGDLILMKLYPKSRESLGQSTSSVA